jgi:DNA primase
LRGIDMILKGGMNVRVVLFPDGEDPDSYSRKVGTTEFQKFLTSNAQDFVSFKIGLYSTEITNDPIKKVQTIRDIADTLALLKDEVKRSPYYKQVKELLGIDEQIIITEINKIRDSQKKKSIEKVEKKDEVIEVKKLEEPIYQLPEFRVYAQEKETIRLLLRYAENNLGNEKVFEFILNELSDVEFSHPTYQKLLSLIKMRLESSKSIDIGYLLESGNNEINECLGDVLVDKYAISPLWKKYNIFVPDESSDLERLVNNNVLRVKFRVIQRMIEDNLKEIRIAEMDKNQKIVDELLDVHYGLKEAERELAGMLGIVVAK